MASLLFLYPDAKCRLPWLNGMCGPPALSPLHPEQEGCWTVGTCTTLGGPVLCPKLSKNWPSSPFSTLWYNLWNITLSCNLVQCHPAEVPERAVCFYWLKLSVLNLCFCKTVCISSKVWLWSLLSDHESNNHYSPLLTVAEKAHKA